jgi:hypothetical protein
MIGQLLSNTNEILQCITVLDSEFGARATNMAGVAPVLIRLAIFARKKRKDGDLRRLSGEADKIRYFGRSDQMINQSRLPKPWDVQVLLPWPPPRRSYNLVGVLYLYYSSSVCGHQHERANDLSGRRQRQCWPRALGGQRIRSPAAALLTAACGGSLPFGMVKGAA